MKKNLKKSTLVFGVIFLTIFSFLVIMKPAPTQAAVKTSCVSYTTVNSGNSIDSIAKKFNVRWSKLVEVNGLKSPYPIYVGQVLCIPASPPKYQSNAPSSAKQPAGDFSAKIKGFSLLLTTTNFPKNAAYYVKITQPTPPSTAIAKIGILKTKDKKSTTQKFYLLNYWRKVTPLQVCLKDANLNTLICRKVSG